ncbi:hypothetical protein [Kitasatospora sp. NPDC051914]
MREFAELATPARLDALSDAPDDLIEHQSAEQGFRFADVRPA